MTTHIIESIGAHGIRTTAYDYLRARRPRPGDHVRWCDGPGLQPAGAPLGRIWEVGTGFCNPDEVHVCESQGSAFLLESGAVSISGGPFRVVKLADLHPTMDLALGTFWNWGDNMRGAGQGVEYHLVRPVFEYRPAS